MGAVRGGSVLAGFFALTLPLMPVLLSLPFRAAPAAIGRTPNSTSSVDETKPQMARCKVNLGFLLSASA